MKSKYLNDQKANFGNDHSLFAVEAITDNITLTAEDSGKFYTVANATGGATVVTLPSPTAGIRYDFAVVEDTPGDTVTITATGALIYGRVLEGEVDTTNDGPYSAGCTTITFADGVAVQGDFIDIWCDGENYYVSGQTKADGGISVA